jgi:hypothetical protein
MDTMCLFCNSQIVDGTFTITSSEPATFHWTAIGKRQDLEVEPYKKDIQVFGNGPYKYYTKL